MDVLFARWADNDVGKGESSRQVKAERLPFFGRFRCVIDRHKVGELATEQRLRLALKIIGQLARNVGQGT